MIVIAINNDKQHLIKLTFDNGSFFLLDSDICIDNNIKIGTNISEYELKELYFNSQYKRAKSRAMWLLGQRDYTEKQLYDKLIAAGFEDEICAKVIARMCELELVNDRRFAQRFIEKSIQSNISKREILSKLYIKGITRNLASEILEEIEIDEENQLNNLIEKKYAYKLMNANGTQKVFASLIRKGYSYSDVRNALRKYIENNEFCEE